jgi:hypothetical protein
LDVSQLIKWAQSLYPCPEGVRIPNPRNQERGTAAQAAAQLAKAYEYHQSGRLQEAGTRDFGYGLTTLATTLMQDRPDAAAATFQVALQTFVPLLAAGSSVDRVMEHCRKSLQYLGVAESNEPPLPFDEPILSLVDLLEGVAPTAPDELFIDAVGGPVEPEDFKSSETVVTL